MSPKNNIEGRILDFEWDRAFIQSSTRADYGGAFGYDMTVLKYG